MAITYVTSYVSGNNFTGSTAPDTASVTCAAGDYLAVVGSSGNSSQIIQTPSGGGLTYTFGNSAGVNTSNVNANFIWVAACPTAQTFTLSSTISPITSGAWGFNVFRFTGVSGMGHTLSANNPSSSAPSGSLTTIGVNSAIVMVINDFNNNAGASPTYLYPFTQEYYSPSGCGSLWMGAYMNTGPIATYVIGQSSPSNQQWALTAVELLCAPLAPPSLISNKALRRSQNY